MDNSPNPTPRRMTIDSWEAVPPVVPCTYKDCSLSFQNVEDMREHKKSDPDHAYCSRCQRDFFDEDDLTNHKLTSPMHKIVCPYCDLECMSEGGREFHVKIYHPASQNIRCTGCDVFYKNASALIRHLERNLCHNIPVLCKTQQEAQQKAKDNPGKEYVPGFVVSGFQDIPIKVTSPISPGSKQTHDWTAHVFKSEHTGHFMCLCGYEAVLEADIRRHVAVDLRLNKSVCVACGKDFTSTSALVSHAEMATVKCNIRKSDGFSRFITEATSGLVKVDGEMPGGTKRLVAVGVEEAKVAYHGLFGVVAVVRKDKGAFW
ncbi:C2H2 finger domain protein [Penicillium verhagenii]|uniref:C2H2 finger domain protein n=1 Tax=Penicillium verhagenii TaxID=1562060 RepID=UPI0025452C4E|nr:C2H2 finger domain protein [Penicillium verhagenii]KAJ5947228.1 C2H2 finger domain protein [Penicillium verhagenii]